MCICGTITNVLVQFCNISISSMYLSILYWCCLYNLGVCYYDRGYHLIWNFYNIQNLTTKEERTRTFSDCLVWISNNHLEIWNSNKMGRTVNCARRIKWINVFMAHFLYSLPSQGQVYSTIQMYCHNKETE